MKNRWLAVLGVASFVGGCDSGGGASPTASAAPSATSPAVSSGATAPASAAPTPATKGRFALVATGDAARIHPLGAAAIVDTGAFFSLLGDGPLEQDPLLTKTSLTTDSGGVVVTPAVTFSAFYGSWPGPVAATSGAASGLLVRVNDIWAVQNPLREGEEILDLVAWGEGRAIAAIKMAEPDIRFALVASKPGAVVPGPGKPTEAQTGCAVRMDPAAPLLLAGLATGHLFAIGKECGTGKPVAERWEPKAVRGVVEVLEGVPGGASPSAIAAASAEEAYAAFDDQLATWDGKAWKAAAAPFGKARSIQVATDGTVFALGDKGLFEKPKGGAFTKVDVEGEVTSFWAKRHDAVWVVIGNKKLMRTGGAAAAPLELPARTLVESTLSRDRRWLATAACKRVYVHLATIGASGGAAPKSYAGIDDAVAGNPKLTEGVEYVVEEIGPSMVVGAKVPSSQIANDLVAAFKAKNAKAAPQLYCHDPIVKAKLLVGAK